MHQLTDRCFPCSCNCERENFFCRPKSCEEHCCHCDCQKPCKCNDPENFFHRPHHPITSCTPNCCEKDMTHVLCHHLGKKVILCVNGIRMRVILCEICGCFIKALAYTSGKTLHINICKIDDIKICC